MVGVKVVSTEPSLLIRASFVAGLPFTLLKRPPTRYCPLGWPVAGSSCSASVRTLLSKARLGSNVGSMVPSVSAAPLGYTLTEALALSVSRTICRCVMSLNVVKRPPTSSRPSTVGRMAVTYSFAPSLGSKTGRLSVVMVGASIVKSELMRKMFCLGGIWLEDTPKAPPMKNLSGFVYLS